MNERAMPDAYGELIEPATLKIQRLLPGSAERVWAYLTESDLRRQWLAAGQMDSEIGSPFELIWRNSELTSSPGQRPEGFGEEHRMKSEITDYDPPRKLSFTWGSTGGVTFELEPRGDKVLLTVFHRRVTDPTMRLNVSAGWHAHLDVLVDRISGKEPPPFWDGWVRLKKEYEKLLSA